MFSKEKLNEIIELVTPKKAEKEDNWVTKTYYFNEINYNPYKYGSVSTGDCYFNMDDLSYMLVVDESGNPIKIGWSPI